MFTYHYMKPENQWGVWDPQGYFVTMFDFAWEAADYCNRHNARR
jgi:hypothetical protein